MVWLSSDLPRVEASDEGLSSLDYLLECVCDASAGGTRNINLIALLQVTFLSYLFFFFFFFYSVTLFKSHTFLYSVTLFKSHTFLYSVTLFKSHTFLYSVTLFKWVQIVNYKELVYGSRILNLVEWLLDI